MKEHLRALFEARFDRVEGDPLAPGQEEGPAFRIKNDGLTCWWMFLYSLGFSRLLLLLPVAFLAVSLWALRLSAGAAARCPSAGPAGSMFEGRV